MPQQSMNYRPVKLGELRRIQLPKEPEAGARAEPDHVTALRSVLKRHRASGDRFRVSVPESIAAMIPSESPAAPAPIVDLSTGPRLLELDGSTEVEPLVGN